MDCLEGMKQIADNSVDCIICDLPYGTTACAWDSIIPFDKLWAEYKRIRKPNAPILLFGSEPFSTMLRMSNLKEWRYDWIWAKSKPTGFQHAKNMPLKDFEIISAFSGGSMGHVSLLGDKRMTYNPQGVTHCHKVVKNAKGKFGGTVGARPSHKDEYVAEAADYPRAILDFASETDTFHPTQKPVDLLRYLVLTYSNEGDIILDNCSGSGTTAVACVKEKRHFICFEKDETYWKKSVERVKNEQRQLTLF